MIPIQCEYYALEGLTQLLRNVELVQRNLNPALEIEGVVMTMFDARTRLGSDVVEQVRRHFGDKAYRTVVPRTVRLSEAPSYGEPIEAFDPMSRGAIAYRELAREFMARHPRGGAVMVTRRSGLGRGLESLIPSGPEPGSLHHLPIEQISSEPRSTAEQIRRGDDPGAGGEHRRGRGAATGGGAPWARAGDTSS